VSQLSLNNHAVILMSEGKVSEAESVYKELAQRFPAARGGQVYPATLMFVRGQYDSTEAFWRTKTNDANPLTKLGALNALSNLALLRGRLKQAADLGAQVRKFNASRGVPPNPVSDSLYAAAIEIWWLGENERGVRALDAALAATPLRNLPVEQRPYFQFALYYATAGRPDKARAMLSQMETEVRDPQLRRALEPGRHSAMSQILLAEKKPLEAIKELWASDSVPDGPSSDCAHCNDADLGRAYDLANQPDSAIAHWERYLSERYTHGVGSDAQVLAGVYKRLGEIYEAKGDTAKAESRYSSFVELWKNADPQLQPKVTEVRKRLAALQARKG
jgi:tetratricopeptide (TPR) repeat protein